jgi:hypothetical protein
MAKRTTAPEADATRLSTEHLLCRMLGHPWQPEVVVLRRKGDPDATLKVTRMTTWREAYFTCVRCGWARVDIVAPSGALVHRRYERYPEGYLVRGPRSRKAFNHEVRDEVLERLRTNRRLKVVG